MTSSRKALYLSKVLLICHFVFCGRALCVWLVNYDGSVYDYDSDYVDVDSSIGVRAVINLKI